MCLGRDSVVGHEIWYLLQILSDMVIEFFLYYSGGTLRFIFTQKGEFCDRYYILYYQASYVSLENISLRSGGEAFMAFSLSYIYVSAVSLSVIEYLVGISLDYI